MSQRQIARKVGLNRTTVRRLEEAGDPPQIRREHPRPGGLSSPTLQPYVSHLQDRWVEGCTNASQLYREIKEQGYGGSKTLLIQAVQAWRPPRPAAPVRRVLQRVGVRGLCLQPPEALSDAEQATLQPFLERNPKSPVVMPCSSAFALWSRTATSPAWSSGWPMPKPVAWLPSPV